MTWTLGQGVDFTLEHRERATKQDRSQLLDVARFFGSGQLLDNIATTDVDKFVKHCRNKGNKNSTIKRKLNMLSAVYRDAMRRGGCSHKPFLPALRSDPGRTRYLTQGEEAAMLAGLLQRGGPGVHDVIVTLLDTGMRKGEVRELRPCDCNFETNMLEIWKNKSDLPRSIPMTRRVAELVAKRMQGPRVFHDVPGWKVGEVWRQVRAALGLSEDKELVPHACRHTCASRRVQRGASLYAVQKVLGHSNINVTERYSHLNPEVLTNTIALLERDPNQGGPVSAGAGDAYARP